MESNGQSSWKRAELIEPPGGFQSLCDVVDRGYRGWKSAYGSAASQHRRTAGQSERDHHEEDQYCASAHGDSLEKTEEEQV